MKKTLISILIAFSLMCANNMQAQETTWSPTATRFALWSPEAQAVKVNIYDNGTNGKPSQQIEMQSSASGTWTAIQAGNLRGKFYTFQIKQNGRWMDETTGPFATAVGVNGKRGAIIDLRDTNPSGWEKDRSPEFFGQQNAIIYEMHHRDFSIDETSGIRNRGKFLALTESGTHNPDGLSTGIDHLKELGVTHVHLLPSYDFGSIDELTGNALGGGGRIPSTYNWGYDPVNYNVPEGSYSTNASDPATRIREFKQMVMALHKAGLRVVMDVVYNHVFDHDKSPFHLTAPYQYFRYKDKEGNAVTDIPSVGQRAGIVPANGSGCGNETASDRDCMRQFMVNSIRYWMTEYHIDGFRFDLMGIHDIETMNEIRNTAMSIDPNVVIYGEGWAAESPAYPADKLAMKANASQLGGIAAFGDEIRDGLRGGWTNDKDGAFLIGKAGNEESVKFGLVGAVQHPQVDMQKVNYSKEAWATDASQMISYVSCHDDMCLADRIKATAPKANKAERMRLQKLAYTAVMTSRGVPFIWCGDEIMRDRKGVHNCYTSPDSINAIPWQLKTENKEVFDYMCQLISLRKTGIFQNNEITFLPVKGSNIIASQYGNDCIVILNSNRKAMTQELPAGQWAVVLSSNATATVSKGKVKVPAQGAVILRTNP